MGIHGLLPQVKSIMSPIHMKDLRGQTVAVDTYSWLHKGALSCSRELCKGLPSDRYINYCMHRVNLLRHYGVKPLLVFDGGLLPMKADQETKRYRSRKENLERAIEHESAGNSTAAYECYQKAVDISPSVASELIHVLKAENVDYLVAPYEADAQMTFLSIHQIVDAVITEDSDLIPFGCSRIIFKMDKFGQGVEFCSSMLSQNKELDFSGFTTQMILEMCILSGCDYLQSLPGMGLKRSHALIQKFKSYDKVIRHLRYNTTSVPPLYEETFQRALWTFLHQRVYDPRIENIVHLTEIPEDVVATDWDFLGPWLPQDVVKDIANGILDPISKMPFEKSIVKVVPKDNVNSTVIQQTREKKRLQLPVQKNILTNYFCMASIEAKRKFKAPQRKPINSGSVGGISSPAGVPIMDACTPEDKIVSYALKRSCSSSSTEEKIEDETGKNLERSINMSCHGISECKERPSLLLQTNQPCVPVLASHKEHGTASVDTSQINGRLGNEWANQSALYRKLPRENYAKINNGDPPLDTRDCVGITQYTSSSKESFESIINKSITKKRKISHNYHQNVQEGTKSLKPPTSVLPVNGENLHCDISHLDKYSSIAEESMKRFVSVISTFTYNSKGSRASGLRAPLKSIQNTSLKRHNL